MKATRRSSRNSVAAPSAPASESDSEIETTLPLPSQSMLDGYNTERENRRKNPLKYENKKKLEFAKPYRKNAARKVETDSDDITDDSVIQNPSTSLMDDSSVPANTTLTVSKFPFLRPSRHGGKLRIQSQRQQQSKDDSDDLTDDSVVQNPSVSLISNSKNKNVRPSAKLNEGNVHFLRPARRNATVNKPEVPIPIEALGSNDSDDSGDLNPSDVLPKKLNTRTFDNNKKRKRQSNMNANEHDMTNDSIIDDPPAPPLDDNTNADVENPPPRPLNLDDNADVYNESEVEIEINASTSNLAEKVSTLQFRPNRKTDIDQNPHTAGIVVQEKKSQSSQLRKATSKNSSTDENDETEQDKTKKRRRKRNRMVMPTPKTNKSLLVSRRLSALKLKQHIHEVISSPGSGNDSPIIQKPPKKVRNRASEAMVFSQQSRPGNLSSLDEIYGSILSQNPSVSVTEPSNIRTNFKLKDPKVPLHRPTHNDNLSKIESQSKKHSDDLTGNLTVQNPSAPSLSKNSIDQRQSKKNSNGSGKNSKRINDSVIENPPAPPLNDNIDVDVENPPTPPLDDNSDVDVENNESEPETIKQNRCKKSAPTRTSSQAEREDTYRSSNTGIVEEGESQLEESTDDSDSGGEDEEIEKEPEIAASNKGNKSTSSQKNKNPNRNPHAPKAVQRKSQSSRLEAPGNNNSNTSESVSKKSESPQVKGRRKQIKPARIKLPKAILKAPLVVKQRSMTRSKQHEDISSARSGSVSPIMYEPRRKIAHRVSETINKASSKSQQPINTNAGEEECDHGSDATPSPTSNIARNGNRSSLKSNTNSSSTTKKTIYVEDDQVPGPSHRSLSTTRHSPPPPKKQRVEKSKSKQRLVVSRNGGNTGNKTSARNNQSEVDDEPWGPNHPWMQEPGSNVLYNHDIWSTKNVANVIAKYGKKRLSDDKIKTLTGNVNQYLEKTFDDLCDETEFNYGVFSHKQVVDMMVKEKLLDKKNSFDQLKTLFKNTLSEDEFKECKEIFFPK